MLFVAEIAATQYISALAHSGVMDNGRWYPPRGTPLYASYEKFRYFCFVRNINRMLCFLDVWMYFVVAGIVDDWQWTVDFSEQCIWIVISYVYMFVVARPPHRTQHLLVRNNRPPSRLALRRRPSPRIMPVASPAVVELEEAGDSEPLRPSPVHNRSVQARIAQVCVNRPQRHITGASSSTRDTHTNPNR